MTIIRFRLIGAATVIPSHKVIIVIAISMGQKSQNLIRGFGLLVCLRIYLSQTKSIYPSINLYVFAFSI